MVNFDPESNDATMTSMECCNTIKNSIGCEWLDNECVDVIERCTDCNFFSMSEYCCMQRYGCTFYKGSDLSQGVSPYAFCDGNVNGCDDYNHLIQVSPCVNDERCSKSNSIIISTCFFFYITF